MIFSLNTKKDVEGEGREGFRHTTRKARFITKDFVSMGGRGGGGGGGGRCLVRSTFHVLHNCSLYSFLPFRKVTNITAETGAIICLKSSLSSNNNNNNYLYLHGHKYIQCCKSFCKLRLKQ